MNRISKYFKQEEKIVCCILKAYINREPSNTDLENTNVIRKIDSSVSEIRYKNILIGKFANKL